MYRYRDELVKFVEFIEFIGFVGLCSWLWIENSEESEPWERFSNLDNRDWEVPPT
jgi:hypothetical protein